MCYKGTKNMLPFGRAIYELEHLYFFPPGK